MSNFIPHAALSQALKRLVAIHAPAPSKKDRPSYLLADQQEALDMICHNMAHILACKPDCVSDWLAIAHYAQLVADRLSADQAPTQETA